MLDLGGASELELEDGEGEEDEEDELIPKLEGEVLEPIEGEENDVDSSGELVDEDEEDDEDEDEFDKDDVDEAIEDVENDDSVVTPVPDLLPPAAAAADEDTDKVGVVVLCVADTVSKTDVLLPPTTTFTEDPGGDADAFVPSKDPRGDLE